MQAFWRNPEFVRHLRSQLRPMRAIAVAAVMAIVCVLVWMSCWAVQQAELEAARRAAIEFHDKVGSHWATRVQHMEADFTRQVSRLFFQWLLGIQAVLVTFWSLAACAQGVLGERDRKTWDFQRTTRLTSGEMVIGKLLGEPVLAYFILACSLPVSLIAGAAGGVSASALFSMYAVLIANALFLGLGGLWLSTMLEGRSRGLFVIGALGLAAFSGLSIPFRLTQFPGLAAFSPYMAMGSYLGGFGGPRLESPTVFGQSVPWAVMSLLLYFCFGAWLALLLVRNIKRDYPDIRPLSRWQALGFAAFLNFIIYALFRPEMGGTAVISTAHDLAELAVILNGVILFVVGLATLTPRERLKVWWRQRAAGAADIFSEEGLPWPWITLSAAAAYGLLVWGLLTWRHALVFDSDSLKTAGVALLAVLIFVIRDVLFLEWCMLTRLRQPVMKGLLYLGLYYTATLVVGGVFLRFSANAGERVMTALTPAGVFDPHLVGLSFPAWFYLGLMLQMGLIAVLLLAIGNRLTRPGMASALATA